MSAQYSSDRVDAANPASGSAQPRIGGTTAPGFEPVLERFAANFRRDDDCREIGAALAVFQGDRCVVDLWGGVADTAGTHPWQYDTLVNVYSTTKGIVACCIGLLVDRGVLRYEDKVASLWPEFEQGGKGNTTIAQVLSHQAGLPAFEESIALEDLYDWDACCTALARQSARWVPGDKTAYHPVTFGYLAGEIVRRATGQSIGRFLAAEIAAPLCLDFFIGLPPALHGRVAQTVAPKHVIDPTALPFQEETRLAITNPVLQPTWANMPEWRSAELPALNGHASASGIARIYSALANGGRIDGRQLLSAATIERMAQVQSHRVDLTLGLEIGWACGVALNGSTGFFGPNPRTFGHSGWGGSFGCADPDARISIGYVCNQMGPDLVGDIRARGLCNVIYECL